MARDPVKHIVTALRLAARPGRFRNGTKGVTAVELAEEAGIGRRQASRLLRRLWELGELTAWRIGGLPRKQSPGALPYTFFPAGTD